MRSSSILLIEKLFVGQEKVMQYYGDGIEFLAGRLPELLGDEMETVFQAIQPDAKALKSRANILKNGYNKVRVLNELDESLQLYDAYSSQVEQDFRTMQKAINTLEHSLNIESVAYKFFRLIFQNQQFKSAIQFFHQFISRSSDDLLKDQILIQENLVTVTDFDEPMMYNIEYAEAIVKTYLTIYSIRDPIEAECLKLSISKEILFDPNLKEEYEYSCENKILRNILNNESNLSPNSFTDEECNILDFMELATLHVDTTPKIAYLIRTIIATTTVKINYLKYPSYNVDVNNLSNYKNVFSKFEQQMEDFASLLISKGTIGMSQYCLASTLIKFLKEFESILKPVILIIKQVSVNIERNIPNKKDIVKEEAHFLEALNSYLNSLSDLNKFIKDKTISSIIENNKAEFDQLDSNLKNSFFELIYFNQRLGYELEIMKLLQHRV